MSRAWLKAATAIPGVEVVGLVDIIEDAARTRAAEFELQQAVISTDFATVLEQTQPDAIFNCTIPDAHYDVTMLALRSGCHVLSEKPLADSLEHAQEMVRTAKEQQRVFAVIQNRRYDPNIRRVRHFLEQEAIGPLTTVNSDFYVGAHFGGFRDHMKHVLLLDMAIHTFDAARLLTNADPVSVFCKEWNPAGSWYDQDASAMAIFEMTNGIVYTYRGSWCAEGLRTTWECDWRFIGQQGSVTWDGGTQQQAQVVAEREGLIANYRDVAFDEFSSEHIGAHAGIIREFFACIKNGTQPETRAEDNIKSLAMVLGAIESAEKGLPVPISW
jgi:predicted dehydrogenase